MLLATAAVALSLSTSPAPTPTPTPTAVLAYATRGDNTIHLVSAADLSPIASIPVGLGAHEIAFSSDGRWLIGSAYGGPGQGHQPADNRLAIVDLAARKLHKTVDLKGLQRPNDIAFVPGTSDAIVTVEVPPRLVRVSAATGQYTEVPLKDKTGHMLTLSPDGQTAFVAHVMPGSLSVVDIASKAVTAKVDLPTGAEGLAISPDGARIWVASNRSGAVSIIDAKTRAVDRRLDCPGFPFRVEFAPSGDRVAISCPGSGEVALFDTADPAKVARVSVVAGTPKQAAPTALAFVDGGRSVAVLCEGPSPELVLISAADAEVTKRVPITGPIPDALASGTLAPSAG